MRFLELQKSLFWLIFQSFIVQLLIFSERVESSETVWELFLWLSHMTWCRIIQSHKLLKAPLQNIVYSVLCALLLWRSLILCFVDNLSFFAENLCYSLSLKFKTLAVHMQIFNFFVSFALTMVWSSHVEMNVLFFSSRKLHSLNSFSSICSAIFFLDMSTIHTLDL